MKFAKRGLSYDCSDIFFEGNNRIYEIEWNLRKLSSQFATKRIGQDFEMNAINARIA